MGKWDERPWVYRAEPITREQEHEGPSTSRCSLYACMCVVLLLAGRFKPAVRCSSYCLISCAHAST